MTSKRSATEQHAGSTTSASAAGGSLGLDAPAPSVVLLGATLPSGRVVDVSITDGLISEIADHGASIDTRTATEDLAGYVLFPSFVEPHAHIDKALTSDVVPNPRGSLDGAIESWLAARGDFSTADISARAWSVITRYLASGTTAIRAHVDTGEGIGLRSFEAVHSLRSALAGHVDLQIVALCSVPVTGPDGAANRSLLRDALDAGAELVGGAPAIDADRTGAVDVLAQIAEDAGVGLDLHIDETLDPEVRTLDRLIDVKRSGFSRPITASHAVSLGQQSPERQAAVARTLAELEISVVTLPQTNLFLQGRGHAGPVPRGLTAVRALLDAGVTVAAGGDNLQDPFNPMGRVDPTETASLLVAAAHLSADEALHAVTVGARSALGLPEVSLAIGSPADLVAVQAPSASRALASGPAARVVFRGGRVVARTVVSTATTLTDPAQLELAWS